MKKASKEATLAAFHAQDIVARVAPGKPAGHGGTAEKVRPLSQQSADKSGDRSGPKDVQ